MPGAAGVRSFRLIGKHGLKGKRDSPRFRSPCAHFFPAIGLQASGYKVIVGYVFSHSLKG